MEYVYASVAGLFLAATILVLQPGAPAAEQQQIVIIEQEQAMSIQSEQWELDVLGAIGNSAPTQASVDFLAAWHRAEGGTAAYNWLNTTQSAPGATDYNSVHVKNYPSYEAGIQATAETLQNGFYPRTLEGLRNNQPVIDDGELGTWGTGGGAVRAQLEETQVREAPAVSLPSGDNTRQALVDYALSLQGIPYVRGGRSASGGDCSGTMEHV